jgi:UDP-glucose 4-epimerase
MVKELAEKNGKSIHLSKTAGIVIKLIGKRVNLINKVFGNLVYEKDINE